MRLSRARVEVRGGSTEAFDVEWSLGAERLSWSVSNRSEQAVALDAVAVVARLDPVLEPLRVLRHGYQSWSPTAVATFRVRIEGEWEGEPFDVTAIMTQVWVRQDGAWLLAASHGSRAR